MISVSDADRGLVDAYTLVQTDGVTFLDLTFQDGSTQTFQLAKQHLKLTLNDLSEDNSKLVNDYCEGRITVNQIRQGFGFEATPEEKDILKRLDSKMEELIQGVMEELVAPIIADQEEEALDDVPNDSYVSLPMGFDWATVSAVVEQLHAAGKSYTLRVDGE